MSAVEFEVKPAEGDLIQVYSRLVGGYRGDPYVSRNMIQKTLRGIIA